MSDPIVRIGVGVVIWRDGKFLMGKRRNSHGHNTWSVPGGHLEFGETYAECAVREALEETGMYINNVRFLALTEDAFPNDNKQYITIWVESDWESGERSKIYHHRSLNHAGKIFALPVPTCLPKRKTSDADIDLKI